MMTPEFTITKKTRRPGDLRSRRAGFTTLELLVVAGILVLLLSLAAAAISSVIYSSERSLAENQLRVAMTAARDAAIRSQTGDAAAVFYFREGRVLVQPCVQVGVLRNDQAREWDNAPGATGLAREVFVPVREVEPIAMPRNWSIRGFSPAGSRVDGWYDWISNVDPQLADRGLWVFPETDFLPRDEQGLLDNTGGVDMTKQGWRRQTFVVRFAAQSGEVVFSNSDPILVLDPPDATYRFDPPFSVYDSQQQNDPAAYVGKLLSESSPLSPTDLATLLGSESTDVILARPVTELALTDDRRLASAIGSRGLSRQTGSFYLFDVVGGAGANDSPIDPSTAPDNDVVELLTRTSDYITATLAGEGISFEARLFSLSRYAGQLQEVDVSE